MQELWSLRGVVQRGRKRETKDTCMYVLAGRRPTNRCKTDFSCALCRPEPFRGTICNWEADGSDDNLIMEDARLDGKLMDLMTVLSRRVHIWM
jgi:hypothetical protein